MSSDNHSYDGIVELDNPLPSWWLITFFLTIIFGGNYMIFFFAQTFPTQEQQLEMDLAARPKAAERVLSENELIALFDNADNVNGGKVVFDTKCGMCHGVEGQGLIGPNLTDKHWLHGKGQRKDILEVVKKGVPEKGMPAWSSVISDNEVIQVSAYVYSLKGTTPANAKPPEGEEVAE